MGKRSDGQFERIEKDFYATIDGRAAVMLERIMNEYCYTDVNYYEPCAGGGDLIRLIDENSKIMKCVGQSDISTGKDALTLTEADVGDAQYIITNPPWSRPLLHSMIMHLKDIRPTFLLFDADWSMNKSSVPYLQYCHAIFPIGRLRWIPDTKMQSKDNCAWYLFDKYVPDTDTIFKNLR